MFYIGTFCLKKGEEMKIYFTESYFMDYSRVGYDSFSITYSLTCSGSENGSSYSSRWYFLEIDDCFTEEEANHLASEACGKSTGVVCHCLLLSWSSG